MKDLVYHIAYEPTHFHDQLRKNCFRSFPPIDKKSTCLKKSSDENAKDGFRALLNVNFIWYFMT